MGVKKVYSKPEIEIDRSVFESLGIISDWGGWDDSEVDTDPVESGTTIDETSGADVSSFENDYTSASSEFNWNWQ